MRQWVIIVCGWLLFGATAHAVPARGVPVPLRQADGTTITIVVRGDEYSGWTSTVDGYQIVQEGGIYYYYQPQVSRAGAGLKASDPSARSGVEIVGLVGRAKGQLDGRQMGGVAGGAGRMTYPLAERLSHSKATSFAPVTAPARMLVLLVNFRDVAFLPAHNQSVFSNLLNESSTSARQYFIDNSRGIYSPSFDVRGPYVLPQPMEYYGGNNPLASPGTIADHRPQEMVVHAVQAAERAGLDFRPYDTDNDGVVDDLYVLYAGANEAEGGGANTIWPHHWSLQGAFDNIYASGVKINSYTCGSELTVRSTSGERELAGIGTFCHEFSHVLGLPDFYDTDGATNGAGVGLYHLSIMSTGNYNNQGRTPPRYSILERWLLGWASLQELQPDEMLTLFPSEQQSSGWRISSPNNDEFYVIESRGATDWDRYLGATGLLVYHVDRSTQSVGGRRAIDRWSDNTLNTVRAHPCVRLIESSGGVMGSSTANASKIFYPGAGGVTSFTGKSYGGVDWRDNAIGVDLTSITNTNGTVSLVTRAGQGTGQALSFRVAQRSVVVTLAPSVYSQEGSYALELQTTGKLSQRVALADRPQTVTVSGLFPDLRYTATLWVTPPLGAPIAVETGNFTTGSLSAPFPALTGIKNDYAVGEAARLGVINLPATPARITFAVNGTELTHSDYTFPSAGRYVVRCTIVYTEQDREVIERTITIK